MRLRGVASVTLVLTAACGGDGAAEADDLGLGLDVDAVTDAPDSDDAVAADAESDAIDALGDASDVADTDTADADDAAEDTAPADVAPDVEPLPLVAWTGEVQPLDTFLCDEAADPEAAPDKVFIACDIEGADYSTDDDPIRDDDTLIVAAYNFERGRNLDNQLELLTSGEHMPPPDVILGSELDRGCDRSDGRNTAQEIAEGLGMHYAYAVEFVELTNDAVARCEHGNALFSRFPLHNVEAIRHAENTSWYDTDAPGTGEKRLGGRVAVSADIVVDGAPLRLVVVHFESHPINGDARDAQAVEMAELGLSVPHPAVVGGDMNAPMYWLEVQDFDIEDPTVHAFLDRGYADAHAGQPIEQRSTAGSGLVIDLIVGTPGIAFTDAEVCPGEVCDAYSDHRPVWATVEWP